MSDRCHVYCENCGTVWDIKCPECNPSDEVRKFIDEVEDLNGTLVIKCAQEMKANERAEQAEARIKELEAELERSVGN